MDVSRSYTIIGSGAIGLYVGAHLVKAGHNVHFVGRTRIDGIHVKFQSDPTHDFHVPASLFTSSIEPIRAHVVIVSVKTTISDSDLKLLLKNVEGSIVVVLQNGLDVEERVKSCGVKDETIVGGIVYTCVRRQDANTVIVHASNMIMLAPYCSKYKGHVGLISVYTDMLTCGLKVIIDENIGHTRWKKLLCNIPLNGLTVVLDSAISPIIHDVQTRTLVWKMMKEIQSVSGKVLGPGIITDEVIHQSIETMEHAGLHTTSSKHDFDNGREMEIDAIFKTFLSYAKDVDVAVPCIEMLTTMLSFMNMQNMTKK